MRALVTALILLRARRSGRRRRAADRDPHRRAERARRPEARGRGRREGGQALHGRERERPVVKRGRLKRAKGSPKPWRRAATADLGVLKAGRYRVRAAGKTSRPWVVSPTARSALVRRLLGLFAANADGDEPSRVFGPAHRNDAIVKGGPYDGQRFDLTGGWRDAGDNLKITQPAAFAVAELELAARLSPADAPALHATADVGLRWLLKAHPRPDLFIGIVGDVRDHNTGFRDPAKDDADTRQGVGIRYAYPTTSSNIMGSAAAALALAAQRSEGAQRDDLPDRRARVVRGRQADERDHEARGRERRGLLSRQHLHRRPRVRRARAAPRDRRPGAARRGDRLLPPRQRRRPALRRHRARHGRAARRRRALRRPRRAEARRRRLRCAAQGRERGARTGGEPRRSPPRRSSPSARCRTTAAAARSPPRPSAPASPPMACESPRARATTCSAAMRGGGASWSGAAPSTPSTRTTRRS